MNDKFISQKHIYMCELDGIGSEQRGHRPVLIVSNNVNNQFSDVVTIIPLTSKKKKLLPVHYCLYKKKYKNLLSDTSTVLCEQIRSIDKLRLGSFVEKIDKDDFDNIIRTVLENFRVYS